MSKSYIKPIRHTYSTNWLLNGLYTILRYFFYCSTILFVGLLFFSLANSIVNKTPVSFLALVIAFSGTSTISFTIIMTAESRRDMISDDEGLHIPILWKRYLVPWEEIVAIKPIFFRRGWVVQIRSFKLVPIRSFEGWYYWVSFRPSIVYMKGISDIEALTRRIKRAAAKQKSKSKKQKGTPS